MGITANAVYRADALSLLERLEQEVATLIYLDPPWYPGDTEIRGKDTFKQHLELLAKIVQQSLRVLTKDGSLFFHSDVRLNSTFRLILDQVFQPDHFVAEYIFPNPVRYSARSELSGHSVLLRYSKTHNYKANRELRPLSEKEISSQYRHQDTQGRYTLTDLSVPLSRQSQQFEWKGIVLPKHRSWKYDRDRLSQLDSEGKIHYTSSSALPRLKTYLDEHPGIEIGTIWDDLKTFALSSKERRGYPAQQPVVLLERVIRIGSNPGDVILDPFCGTGTAFVAAQTLQRQWIGCDINQEGFHITVNRLCEHFGLYQGSDFTTGEQSDIEEMPVISQPYSRVVTGVGELNATAGVIAMIAEGEGQTLEFKSTACWNAHKGMKDQDSVDNIIETVAGFLNSVKGGVLLIGVNDDGSVIGLADDYKSANKRKPNRDGYQLFLRNVLNSNLGTETISFYSMDFHYIEGKEICQITVIHADKPVFFRDELYVRNGNQTCKLKAREAIAYHKTHWK